MQDELIEFLKDKPTQYAKLAIQEQCKNDLYFLAKQILGYKDITRYTHGQIIKALESSNHRKLIVCPRGSFKSSICVTSYSIWRLIKNPNLRILIDSELYNNSKNFIREIKSHLESPLMTLLFGEFKSQGNWSEGSITIKQRTKGFKESSITAGGVETEKTGQHFDILLLDDLNSPNNSQTPEARQKIIDHYRYCNAILEPEGDIVIVGTRYSSDDIIGFVLSQEMGLDPMNGEGLYNPGETNTKGLIV